MEKPTETSSSLSHASLQPKQVSQYVRRAREQVSSTHPYIYLFTSLSIILPICWNSTHCSVLPQLHQSIVFWQAVHVTGEEFGLKRKIYWWGKANMLKTATERLQKQAKASGCCQKNQPDIKRTFGSVLSFCLCRSVRSTPHLTDKLYSRQLWCWLCPAVGGRAYSFFVVAFYNLFRKCLQSTQGNERRF